MGVWVNEDTCLPWRECRRSKPRKERSSEEFWMSCSGAGTSNGDDQQPSFLHRGPGSGETAWKVRVEPSDLDAFTWWVPEQSRGLRTGSEELPAHRAEGGWMTGEKMGPHLAARCLRSQKRIFFSRKNSICCHTERSRKTGSENVPQIWQIGGCWWPKVKAVGCRSRDNITHHWSNGRALVTLS